MVTQQGPATQFGRLKNYRKWDELTALLNASGCECIKTIEKWKKEVEEFEVKVEVVEAETAVKWLNITFTADLGPYENFCSINGCSGIGSSASLACGFVPSPAADDDSDEDDNDETRVPVMFPPYMRLQAEEQMEEAEDECRHCRHRCHH
ncbi:hypothetical protein EVAR_87979_1 [Eumeta japonica]|uniref:Uncharacterized protein n=1 Tax=Eumeta variegata TaxID=151549 RepID=A0A4C1VCZ2_EUMVA|nr:hypothetical protein EVAR_87979_1 [Eumeta japonica]